MVSGSFQVLDGDFDPQSDEGKVIKKQIQLLNEVLNNVRAKLEETVVDPQKLMVDNKFLEGQVKELTNAKNDIMGLYNNSQTQNEHLRDEANILKQERDNLRQQLDSVIKDRDDLAGRYNDLVATVESQELHVENNDFQEEVAVLPQQSASLPQESANLPHQSANLPHQSANLPHHSATLPQESTSMPHPQQSTTMPHPHQSTRIPQTQQPFWPWPFPPFQMMPQPFGQFGQGPAHLPAQPQVHPVSHHEQEGHHHQVPDQGKQQRQLRVMEEVQVGVTEEATATKYYLKLDDGTLIEIPKPKI